MALVRAHKINSVELDLKDEAGEIGWNPQVPLARRMHSALAIYDLGKAVQQLHARGVRVIGRLVCFRDPIHAAAAWKAGRRNEVVQTPDGAAVRRLRRLHELREPGRAPLQHRRRGRRRELGVDEILYDYVRRPDGPLTRWSSPACGARPSRESCASSPRARRRSRDEGLLGASVFGVAATRPTEVAQDIPAMARNFDYVAPMVYPSHWGRASTTSRPERQPVRDRPALAGRLRPPGARHRRSGRALAAGLLPRARLRPGRGAGADHGRARRGRREFLLWDPAVSYTRGRARPDAATRAGSRRAAKDAPARAAPPTAAGAEARREAGRRPKQPRRGLAVNELGADPDE